MTRPRLAIRYYNIIHSLTFRLGKILTLIKIIIIIIMSCYEVRTHVVDRTAKNVEAKMTYYDIISVKIARRPYYHIIISKFQHNIISDRQYYYNGAITHFDVAVLLLLCLPILQLGNSRGCRCAGACVRVRGVRSTWREQSVGLLAYASAVYRQTSGWVGGGVGTHRGGCDGGARIVDRAPACYYTLALLYISSQPSHA